MTGNQTSGYLQLPVATFSKAWQSLLEGSGCMPTPLQLVNGGFPFYFGGWGKQGSGCIHLNIATCKWWFPTLFGWNKKPHVSNGKAKCILRSPAGGIDLLVLSRECGNGGFPSTKLQVGWFEEPCLSSVQRPAVCHCADFTLATPQVPQCQLSEQIEHRGITRWRNLRSPAKSD